GTHPKLREQPLCCAGGSRPDWERGRNWGGLEMPEMAVETTEAASANGVSDPVLLEPKATVLAREDMLSGKLTLKGPGQVLGNFNGEIECGGDVVIGAEGEGEGDGGGAGSG